MNFPSSSIDANLGFLCAGLRLYFQDVSDSLRGFGIFKCCSSWTSQLFRVYDKDAKLFFFENKPGLYFQIFPNSLKSWEIWISKAPLISPPIFEAFLLQKDTLGTRLTNKQRISQKKNDSIDYILLNFA